jgi:urease accessory protein
MNLKKHSRTFALAALGLFAGTASAHTGDHAVTGFVSGLAHPLLGLDHLFAMIAIGLWAAQQGGRALWAVPAAFVGAMVVGGGLAWSGIALPQVETAIALSVLVLGLLIATRRQWAVTAGMALAAGFRAVPRLRPRTGNAAGCVACAVWPGLRAGHAGPARPGHRR